MQQVHKLYSLFFSIVLLLSIAICDFTSLNLNKHEYLYMCIFCLATISDQEQEGLAVASIVRDDPSTLPGDDPFLRAHMHRDRNGR